MHFSEKVQRRNLTSEFGNINIMRDIPSKYIYPFRPLTKLTAVDLSYHREMTCSNTSDYGIDLECGTLTLSHNTPFHNAFIFL